MNFNPRQKLFVTSGLFFAVAALLAYFAVFLPLGKIGDVRRAVSALREDGVRLATQKSSILHLSQEASLVAPHKGRFRSILLKETDIVQLVGTAEKLAQNLAVEMEISPRASTRADQRGLAFQLLMLGSFQDILRFSESLQNLRYFIDVDAFSMRSLDKLEVGRLAQTKKVKEGDVEARIDIFVPTP